MFLLHVSIANADLGLESLCIRDQLLQCGAAELETCDMQMPKVSWSGFQSSNSPSQYCSRLIAERQ